MSEFKYGEMIEVTDYGIKWFERIFIHKDYKSHYSEVRFGAVVRYNESDEEYRKKFENGDYNIEYWKYARKIKDKKYEPYTEKDRLVLKVIKNKENTSTFVIISQDKYSVRVGVVWVMYQDLFENFLNEDGTPCGNEVTE